MADATRDADGGVVKRVWCPTFAADADGVTGEAFLQLSCPPHINPGLGEVFDCADLELHVMKSNDIHRSTIKQATFFSQSQPRKNMDAMLHAKWFGNLVIPHLVNLVLTLTGSTK